MIRSVSGGMSVIVLRDEVIPIIRLKEYFNQTENFEINARDLAVIVQNNEKKKFALFLDEIVTKREVFIKSLGSRFRQLKGISSGTILQGGKIGFVLDIETICRDTGAGDAVSLSLAMERE
jgi:two-component system chemotaxis sensor kinase CheA